ncbi:hypothetical protein KAFR_0F03880 [Kazachstania africana CBS 2517]|uniref:Uncharacterized protein n=1 Tax=Kazachstania africana (strain ATCC 22294 / BCRC 22015 / CBS 2517 / CECT 1963 / NBRC 1671 / NRRL Y-8276) TaxID=1071382 RepID=H2AX84_KAZAF|nr:hypothetical protein KAFR_0F03880 [Kazachstania africana CBS 2517]CCF58984.1 hypothetical protein KAFR_0F03880 [Kazachstania africana CBS 2517]
MNERISRTRTNTNSSSLSRSRANSYLTRSRTNSNKSMAEPFKDHRRKRSSSIISHVEQESMEDINDQNLLPNMNATWVDQRGAWIIHIVIIILLKLFFNLLPGITNESAWSLTNTIYVIGSYIMFHLIKGTPFDFNGGAYDNLTMWEQIDDETLYTPTRKFLIILPIILLLISNHYAKFSYNLFTMNSLIILFLGVVPKLPSTHRLRIQIPGLIGPAQIT